MDKQELIDRAAPECPECGAPIINTEVVYRFIDHGRWRARGTFICPNEHRTPVLEEDR